jgi:hypothetical protein
MQNPKNNFEGRNTGWFQLTGTGSNRIILRP